MKLHECNTNSMLSAGTMPVTEIVKGTLQENGNDSY